MTNNSPAKKRDTTCCEMLFLIVALPVVFTWALGYLAGGHSGAGRAVSELFSGGSKRKDQAGSQQ